jgi:hypothetical protein
LNIRLLFAYIPNGENMANHALAVLETALRDRKLDRTLTTALPPLERVDPASFLPFDIAAVDRVLRGGLPRGQVSELAGSQSSGRTTLLLQLLGAVTRGGEIAALVDTCDRLDVASASAAGVDLNQLLWVRGESELTQMTSASLRSPRASPAAVAGNAARIVDRALKALTLVLQAGGFAVVAIDLADVPPRVLKSLPFTTWLRLQRVVEGSDTACVLVTPEPLARSAGGLTVMCTGQTTWSRATVGRAVPGAPVTEKSVGRALSGTPIHLTGFDTAIRVVSPRRRVDGTARVAAVASGGPWR